MIRAGAEAGKSINVATILINLIFNVATFAPEHSKLATLIFSVNTIHVRG